MSKAGRLTTDKWGAYAPVHSPAVQRSPLYFRNAETVAITWTTDEDAILDILPPVLSLHEPATAFMVLRTTIGAPSVPTARSLPVSCVNGKEISTATWPGSIVQVKLPRSWTVNFMALAKSRPIALRWSHTMTVM